MAYRKTRVKSSPEVTAEVPVDGFSENLEETPLGHSEQPEHLEEETVQELVEEPIKHPETANSETPPRKQRKTLPLIPKTGSSFSKTLRNIPKFPLR